MSATNVNQISVLAALDAGCTSRAKLAEHFGVALGDEFLRRSLNDLEHHGHIAWNRKTGEVTAR